MRQFDLEYQYQLYLQRVGLDENQMHEVQKVETKRAFMGACGQMLILFRDEATVLDEDSAIDVFEFLAAQVSDFFTKEAARH